MSQLNYCLSLVVCWFWMTLEVETELVVVATTAAGCSCIAVSRLNSSQTRADRLDSAVVVELRFVAAVELACLLEMSLMLRMMSRMRWTKAKWAKFC